MLKRVDNVQQAVTSSFQLRDNAGAHLPLKTHILIWPHWVNVCSGKLEKNNWGNVISYFCVSYLACAFKATG